MSKTELKVQHAQALYLAKAYRLQAQNLGKKLKTIINNEKRGGTRSRLPPLSRSGKPSAPSITSLAQAKRALVNVMTIEQLQELLDRVPENQHDLYVKVAQLGKSQLEMLMGGSGEFDSPSDDPDEDNEGEFESDSQQTDASPYLIPPAFPNKKRQAVGLSSRQPNAKKVAFDPTVYSQYRSPYQAVSNEPRITIEEADDDDDPQLQSQQLVPYSSAPVSVMQKQRASYGQQQQQQQRYQQPDPRMASFSYGAPHQFADYQVPPQYA